MATDGLEIRLRAKDRLINNLRGLTERVSPQSPAIRAALTRAAIVLTSQMKLNIRAQNIVDQGRLLNSIRYEISRGDSPESLKILVGSFGVPYAAMHEFGGTYSLRQMRAMFASLREQGKLDSKKKSGGKGLLVNRVLTARPYIRPAFQAHKDRVSQLLMEAIEKG